MFFQCPVYHSNILIICKWLSVINRIWTIWKKKYMKIRHFNYSALKWYFKAEYMYEVWKLSSCDGITWTCPPAVLAYYGSLVACHWRAVDCIGLLQLATCRIERHSKRAKIKQSHGNVNRHKLLSWVFIHSFRKTMMDAAVQS